MSSHVISQPSGVRLHPSNGLQKTTCPRITPSNLDRTPPHSPPVLSGQFFLHLRAVFAAFLEVIEVYANFNATNAETSRPKPTDEIKGSFLTKPWAQK